MDLDLNDAKFFAQVVELASFSAAARHAGVPVSTVSRRVARLEARLGVRLLLRTTRRIGLTDAGRLYHAHAARAVEAIEAGERGVQALGTQPRGRVRLTAPLGVARLVWPLVSEFLARWSDVRIELDAREQRVDLVDEGYDLAIRTGELPDSSLFARKIVDATRALFASGSYLARRGAPRRLGDLASHDCIVHGGGRGPASWAIRRRGKVTRITIAARVVVNEMGLAHQACLDGAGIAILPTNLADTDVAAGRLVRMLPTHDAGSAPIWLVHPAGRIQPNAVRLLAEHLAARMPALLPSQPRPRG